MGRLGERWKGRGRQGRDAFEMHERMYPPGGWNDPVTKLTWVGLSVTLSIGIGRLKFGVLASIDAGLAVFLTIDIDRHALDAGSGGELHARISRASWEAGPSFTQRNGAAALVGGGTQGFLNVSSYRGVGATYIPSFPIPVSRMSFRALPISDEPQAPKYQALASVPFRSVPFR